MAAKTETACVHHWKIAESAGTFSVGTCRKCGEAREFRNSIDPDQFRWGRRAKKRGDDVEAR